MATIVSSQIVEDAVQLDRRRAIHEIHIDDSGRVYHVFYLAESGARVDNILAARAVQLAAGITASDAERADRIAKERQQAVSLLELTDDQLSKILIVELSEVPATREELSRRSVAPAEIEEKR